MWQASGWLEPAVRLLGAAARILDELAFSLWPHDRARLEELVTALRASLGEDAFAAAWAEGEAVSLDEAVAYAMEEQED